MHKFSHFKSTVFYQLSNSLLSFNKLSNIKNYFKQNKQSLNLSLGDFPANLFELNIKNPARVFSFITA